MRWWLAAALGLGLACGGGVPGFPARDAPLGPASPPGDPAEPRLLGTDRWRVPSRAVGLGWRGDEVLLAHGDALLVVGSDGAVRREALPEAATALGAGGGTVVIGVEGGDLVRVGDGLRLAGDGGRVVAVDVAEDGTIAALGAPVPLPPSSGGEQVHRHLREWGWVARWSADGQRTGGWTVDDCRPQGLAQLRGALLVGCGFGERAAVIDVASGAVERIDLRVERVVRDPGGSVAATVSGGEIAVWRPGAHRPERTVTGSGVRAIAVTATGDVLTASEGRVILGDGREIPRPAWALALSPDQQTVAGRDGARIWRAPLASGVPSDTADEGHDHSVAAVALSADGRAAASVSLEGTVRRWDTVSGRSVDVWEVGPRAHAAAVAIAGPRLAVATRDRVVARDGAAWTLPDLVTGLSSDGSSLFAHVEEERYRLDPGGDVVAVGPGAAPTGPYGRFPTAFDTAEVTAAAWSAAGFVTGHDDGTVRVWSVAGR